MGPGTDARLQVETVSKKPIPEGVQAMSEVDVTDWYWSWNPYTTQMLNSKQDTEPEKMLFIPSVFGVSAKILAPVQDQTMISPFTIQWRPAVG